jgi:3-hydroxymyristoyl/3-hydroxydecanoyl-(acyl carrier protein) dehydratase
VRRLADAPSDLPISQGDGAARTAGEIRAMAARAVQRFGAAEGRLFLHADGVSACMAGLLAGAVLRREVCLLPQAQPAYLVEIGAGPHNLMSDTGENPALVCAGSDADLKVDEAFDLPLRFFTSGSTGAPKEVEKRWSQIEAEARSWAAFFAGRIDRVAGTVSHQHIYGLIFRLALPLEARWITEDAQAFTWETFAAQLGPRTLGVTSPAHLTRMPPGLSAAGGPAMLLSSGGPLPLQGALDAAEAFGQPPLEILGSTETGGVAMRQRRDDAEAWTPLAGVDLRLSEEGVLSVRSPYADGETWTQMGDRAELLTDGRFRLLARADRIVKIEGKRVSLPRVEAALASLDEVTEAAALALPDKEGEKLCAAVVLAEPGRRALARLGAFRFSRSLRAKLADSLEPSERPKRWRFVGRLPQTAQGKRTLTDLAALFAAQQVLPLLEAELSTGDVEATLRFTLRETLPFFEGHFPGQPILAGVVQVHLAVRLAEELWGIMPPSHAVSRLKFRKVLKAGQAVSVSLKRDPETSRLTFQWRRGEDVVSDGVVG